MIEEEKVMGSDGVSRRMFDWVLFIRCREPDDNEVHSRDFTGRALYDYAHLAWSYKAKNLDLYTKLECVLEGDAEYKYQEAKERLGEFAKEHFMSVLEDAISENMSAPSERSIEDVMDTFTDEIKKLSRRTTPKFRNKESAFYKVGECLEDYILKRDAMPASPKELEAFSIENGKRVARRTIAEHLPRYCLDNVIRGNEPL